MADPLSAASAVLTLISLVGDILKYTIDYYVRPVSYVRLYGISGAVLAVFGSKNVWGMQAEVLGSRNDETAMAFRKSVQDESTTCAVAAAIVSQIAITALSLPFLSQTHWVAKGFWIFSLISGIMAVYYASRQHRTMGRLLLPSQVRRWIRGENGEEPDITDGSYRNTIIETYRNTITSISGLSELDRKTIFELWKPFKPSPSSVITISAPQLLLSGSLYSFLLGLGVYVSFLWRRELDPNAGSNDSRNIFITYIVSVAVCQIIYSISSVVQDERKADPYFEVQVNFLKFTTASMENIQATTDQRGTSLIPNTSFSHTSSDGAAPQAIHSQLSASAATEMLQTPEPAIGPDGYETRATSLQGHAEILHLSSQHQVLIKALQDSARLRRESARLEEVIARCYEQLSIMQPAEKADGIEAARP